MSSTVKIDEGPEYQVDTVRLHRSLGTAPRLELRLATEETKVPLEPFAWSREGKWGRLTWGSETIKFLAAGGREPALERDGQKAAWSLFGLVLQREHVEWLQGRPYLGEELSRLVYQRKEDQQGWAFLDRMLNGLLAGPRQGEIFDALVPRGACLWRSASASNLDFLRRLMEWLRGRHSDLLGWTLVRGERPIRLCVRDPRDVPLLPDFLKPIGTYLLHPLLDRGQETPFLVEINKALPSGQKPELLLGDLIKGEADTKNWPEPGLVRVGTQPVVCRAAEYRFSGGRGVNIRLELEPYPVAAAANFEPLLLDGVFDGAWEAEAESEERTLLQLQPAGPWAVLNGSEQNLDDTQLRSDTLWAWSLVPQAERDGRCGIHPVRKKGDRMVALIAPGQTAAVLGERQCHREAFESAGLVIGSDRLLVTTSPHDVELGKMDGLDLDEAAGRAELRATDAGTLSLDAKISGATLKAEAALTLEIAQGDLSIASNNASLGPEELHLRQGELKVG